MMIRSLEQLERRDLLTTDLLPELGQIPRSSDPRDFVLAGERLYFSAQTGSETEELWVTDGTPAGTTQLRSDTPRVTSLAVGSELFFSSPNGRLMRTSGTPNSTVDATNANIQLVEASELVEFNGQVFFVGNELSHPDQPGVSLMRTDGTPENSGYAHFEENSQANTFVRILGVWDDQIHYTFENNEFSPSHQYRAGDGTLDGMQQPPGYAEAFAQVTPQVEVGDYIIGVGLLDEANFDEQTYELVSINPSNDWSREDIEINPKNGSFPTEIVAVSHEAYFIADDGTHGVELWKTDGTSAGTQMVADIVPGFEGSSPSWLTPFGDSLLFSAAQGLWSLDVTTSQLNLIHQFASEPSIPTPFGPRYLTVASDAVYFSAANGDAGEELWKYDGTSVSQVVDLYPGPLGSGPTNLTLLNDQLIFSGFTPDVGRELWAFNLADDEVQLLADLHVGTTPSPSPVPRDLTIYQGITYFRANDRVHGSELWRSDGTPEGTFMLADIHPGPGSSGPRDFFLFQDQLYFLANDGQRGYELWRTDGTAAGTEFFVETWPGIDALIDNVAVGDTKFFFTASDGQHGSELWESDGTRAGTRMTEDLVEGLPSPPMRLLLPDGDEVYFQVDQTVSPSLVGESFTGKWDGSQMTVVRSQSELWTNPRFMEIWNDELLIVGFRATHVGTTQLLGTRSTPLPPRFLSSGELILAARSNLLFVPSPTQKTPISTLAVDGFETVGRHVFYWRRQGSSMNLIRWNSDLEPDSGEVLLQDFEVLATKHHGDSLVFLTRGEGGSVDVWGLQEEGPAQKWGELAHEPREFVLNGNDLIYIARKDGALDETVYRTQLNRPLEGPDLVDALFAAIAANETDPQLDRNDDDAVDEADIDYLFTQELQTNRADLDLNGTVDFGDFLILSANFGKTSDVRWSLGDIDNNNNVGFADFLFLSAAFGAE